MSDSTSYVGVAIGGPDTAAQVPLRVSQQRVSRKQIAHILLELSDEQLNTLTHYLRTRLSSGVRARDRRINRYSKIDRLISTWQKLSPEDSKREQTEDNTGRQAALPVNLPVLASSLDDYVSYFAEALAPISNPFFSANGDKKVAALLDKFNRDAAAQNYYGNLVMTLRSLLKYNLGGFRINWDSGTRYGKTVGSPGNSWKSLDLYNTLWDPSIREPTNLSSKGEWAATIEIENRLEIVRRAIAGEWVNLGNILESNVQSHTNSYYREPAVSANIGQEGLDSRTSDAKMGAQQIDWSAYGLGLATDLGPEVDGFETVDMVAYLVPCQFGLLTQAEEDELTQRGEDPELWLEMWRFVLVNDRLVHAEPILDRSLVIQGEKQELPFYLAFLTNDQLKEAQRSLMELQRGFQRFASAMYNIYTAGMRKNVWGQKAYDASAIDEDVFKRGDAAGAIRIKQPGRDVRTAISDISTSSGVQETLTGVNTSLELKNRFFPAQALPSQIAGIDRAVKSQVTQVTQGATRPLRTLLRLLDANLMRPTRIKAYRNLKIFDPEGVEAVTDEDVAKLMGSGIESIEAERVSELLWQLLYAIIQNQESMQVFNIPDMFTYLGRVGNLSVDLGSFVRQQQQPAQPAQPMPEEPPAQ